MGAACCVAIKDRTIYHGSSGEFLHRNVRHSPTWSFRWDNRVGVVVEDPSVGWSSDVASRSDVLDLKSVTNVSAIVSDEGSSLESFRMGAWCKSPFNCEITKSLRPSSSGQFTARDSSSEVKQSAEALQACAPTSFKQSPSMHATSSLCLSPSSVQSYPLPSPPSLSRWAQGSPGPHAAQQTSEIHSSGRSSPMDGGHALHGNATSNESTRGSYGRSSDGWSAHAFSELTSTSQGGRWSFGSDSLSLSRDKLSRTTDQTSRSMSVDIQSCGICSKLLTDKSARSSQKIVTGHELSVVAVLLCGHVYHAECLEAITPEINKYDPDCPVCTFGEKQTLKLAGKMLKGGKDVKARISKKSRNQVVDTDGTFDFDHWKTSPCEGKNPKLSNSSSLKISAAKPFLKRHFSFGSKANKSTLEDPSIRKKGLF